MKSGKLFFNNAFIENPYPFYKELRNQNKPSWIEPDQEVKSEGIWLFSKYNDVHEVLKQTKNISKDINQARAEENKSVFDLNLLNMDGLKHAENRKIFMQYFSASKIDLILPLLTKKIDELLTEMLKKNEFNFVTEFAEPLPIYIIGLIIGLPFEDLDEIRKSFTESLNTFDSFLDKNKYTFDKRIDFINSFKVYFKNTIAQKKLSEGSLLADLLSPPIKHTLSEDELIGMIFFLFIAGHETTISLISSLFFLLNKNPVQYKDLNKNRDLIMATIEESLRYESPLQRSTFRVTTASININGFAVPKNQQIIALIGSANRDESIFVDPDLFDIRRESNPHLAFGYGVHNCFGRQLAITEARLAILALLDSIPNLDLYELTPYWKKNSLFRSLDALICRAT